MHGTKYNFCRTTLGCTCHWTRSLSSPTSSALSPWPSYGLECTAAAPPPTSLLPRLRVEVWKGDWMIDWMIDWLADWLLQVPAYAHNSLPATRPTYARLLIEWWHEVIDSVNYWCYISDERLKIKLETFAGLTEVNQMQELLHRILDHI